MMKFIKAKIAQMKKRNADKKKLKNMQQYYLYLRYGALFLQYINEDLEKGKKNINRSARRRWEREISKSGKFSREMVEFYAQRVEAIKRNIDAQMKPKKQVKKIISPKVDTCEVKKKETNV